MRAITVNPQGQQLCARPNSGNFLGVSSWLSNVLHPMEERYTVRSQLITMMKLISRSSSPNIHPNRVVKKTINSMPLWIITVAQAVVITQRKQRVLLHKNGTVMTMIQRTLFPIHLLDQVLIYFFLEQSNYVSSSSRR